MWSKYGGRKIGQTIFRPASFARLTIGSIPAFQGIQSTLDHCARFARDFCRTFLTKKTCERFEFFAIQFSTEWKLFARRFAGPLCMAKFREEKCPVTPGAAGKLLCLDEAVEIWGEKNDANSASAGKVILNPTSCHRPNLDGALNLSLHIAVANQATECFEAIRSGAATPFEGDGLCGRDNHTGLSHAMQSPLMIVRESAANTIGRHEDLKTPVAKFQRSLLHTHVRFDADKDNLTGPWNRHSCF